MLIFPKDLFHNPAFLSAGWDSFFPAAQPLNLEIGCGYGHFIQYMAQRFPEQNFIGLDIVNKVLQRAAKRVEGLANAHVCKGDAALVIQELVADASLANLYILFPDPWFKDRHQERRIMRASTLPQFARKLQPGGHLHFVSDDPPYAEAAKALLDASPLFESVPFPEIEIKTKYEKKWLAQQKEIWRFCYRRKPEADLPSPQPWQPQALAAELPLEVTPELRARLQRWQLQLYREGDHVIRFRGAYRNLKADRWLIRLTLAEPGLMSHTLFVELDGAGQLRIPDTSYLPRVLHRQDIFALMGRAIAALVNEVPPEQSETHTPGRL